MAELFSRLSQVVSPYSELLLNQTRSGFVTSVSGEDHVLFYAISAKLGFYYSNTISVCLLVNVHPVYIDCVREFKCCISQTRAYQAFFAE